MRAVGPAAAMILTSCVALAEPITVAANGAWSTLSDTSGQVKGCAIQAKVNGGQFTVWGATDRQGVLRVSLFKSTWQIPDLAVPIEMAFANGESIRLNGSGSKTLIRADVPADLVKSFVHYFTAEDSATVTLPEGHEAPWHLDLHGTTPATLAMTQCIDTAGLLLPPPFRPPQAPNPDANPAAVPPPAMPPAETTPPANATSADAPPVAPLASGAQDQASNTSPEVSPSPEPSSTSTDATSAPPAESTPPHEPQSATPPQENDSGNGATILILVVIVVGGAIAFLVYKVEEANTERRLAAIAARKAALIEHIAHEIESNSQALAIKRIQTVTTDHYGTKQYERWIKEKEYYFKTRLAPILGARGYTDWPDGVFEFAYQMVEDVSTRPLPDGFVMPDDYVSSPEAFDARMDPLDYERYCAVRLQRAGWDTRTTAATGDQGADVIATQGGKTLVLQCKLYSKPIGNDAVQQVHAAKTFQAAHFAAVCSNQPYTRSARELASVSGVYLLHHEELATFRPAPLGPR